MTDLQIIETKVIGDNKWMATVTKYGVEHAFFVGKDSDEAYSYAEMYIHFYLKEHHPSEYSKSLSPFVCDGCHAMFEEECVCEEFNSEDDE